MKVEILAVSFLPDKHWLMHCLNSIEKFAVGFTRTTILVPEQERNEFEDISGRCRLVTYRRTPEKVKWHIDHQRMKCRADELCPDADVIFHIDSDTFFTGRITPQDVCPNGKPMLIIGSYENIFKTGGQNPWKPVVDFVMGGDNKYETIRLPHPCYWRAMYKDVRTHIEERHKQDFDSFVLAQKADFPWGFCDNNMLGFMCLTPKWRDKYHVVDVDTEGWPHIQVAHFWSHSPPDNPISIYGLNIDPKLVRKDGTVIPNEVYAHYGI
jgi:hypothetical protein